MNGLASGISTEARELIAKFKEKQAKAMEALENKFPQRYSSISDILEKKYGLTEDDVNKRFCGMNHQIKPAL